MNNNLKDLEKQFNKALEELYQQWLSIGHRATRFRQMLNRYGGLISVKKLLYKTGTPFGFNKLSARGRIDLTIENLILENPWNRLFSDDEKTIARQRLNRP
jgi:5-methylcytosine-specific restriction enzyme A